MPTSRRKENSSPTHVGFPHSGKFSFPLFTALIFLIATDSRPNPSEGGGKCLTGFLPLVCPSVNSDEEKCGGTQDKAYKFQ